MTNLKKLFINIFALLLLSNLTFAQTSTNNLNKDAESLSKSKATIPTGQGSREPYDAALNRVMDGLNIPNSLKCSEFFKPGEVTLEMNSGSAVLEPGTDVEFTGFAVNKSELDIPNVKILVKVTKTNNSTSQILTGSNEIVSQFYLENTLNLASKSKSIVKYKWTVPTSISKGEYVFNHFAIANDSYYLNGLPTAEAMSAGIVILQSKSELSKNAITFEDSTYKLNGEKHKITEYFPSFTKSKDVKMEINLSNNTENELIVPLVFSLYKNTNPIPSNLVDSNNSSIKIPANSSKVVTYTFVKQDKNAKELLVVEANYKDSKSIINARVNRYDVANTVVDFLGLKGDKVFACLHNGSTGLSRLNNITFVLTDKKTGNQIMSTKILTDLSSGKMAIATTSKLNSKNFTLSLNVENKESKTQDSVDFNCSLLANCLAINSSANASSSITDGTGLNSNFSKGFIFVFFAIILILTGTYLYMNKKNNILPLILAFSLFATLNNADAAKTVSTVQERDDLTSNVCFMGPLVDLNGNGYADDAPIGGWCGDKPKIVLDDAVTTMNRTSEIYILNAGVATPLADNSSVNVGSTIRIKAFGCDGSNVSWYGEQGPGSSFCSPNGNINLASNGQPLICDPSAFVTRMPVYYYDDYIPVLSLYAYQAVNPWTATFNSTGASITWGSVQTDASGNFYRDGVVNSAGSINLTSNFSSTYSNWNSSYFKENAWGCWGTNSIENTVNYPAQSVSFNLTSVNPNQNPVTTSLTGPTSVGYGGTYTYTVIGTDPDDDKVNYCIIWNSTSTSNCTFIPALPTSPSGVAVTFTKAFGVSDPANSYVFVCTKDNQHSTCGPVSKTLNVTVSSLGGNLGTSGASNQGAWECNNADTAKLEKTSPSPSQVLYSANVPPSTATFAATPGSSYKLTCSKAGLTDIIKTWTAPSITVDATNQLTINPKVTTSCQSGSNGVVTRIPNTPVINLSGNTDTLNPNTSYVYTLTCRDSSNNLTGITTANYTSLGVQSNGATGPINTNLVLNWTTTAPNCEILKANNQSHSPAILSTTSGGAGSYTFTASNSYYDFNVPHVDNVNGGPIDLNVKCFDPSKPERGYAIAETTLTNYKNTSASISDPDQDDKITLKCTPQFDTVSLTKNGAMVSGYPVAYSSIQNVDYVTTLTSEDKATYVLTCTASQFPENISTAVNTVNTLQVFGNIKGPSNNTNSINTTSGNYSTSSDLTNNSKFSTLNYSVLNADSWTVNFWNNSNGGASPTYSCSSANFNSCNSSYDDFKLNLGTTAIVNLTASSPLSGPYNNGAKWVVTGTKNGITKQVTIILIRELDPLASIYAITDKGNDTYDFSIKCENSLSYTLTDKTNNKILDSGNISTANFTKSLTYPLDPLPVSIKSVNVELTCNSRTSLDVDSVGLPVNANLPADIQKFTIFPSELVCGGGDAILSWDIKHSKGKNCRITPATTKDINLYGDPAGMQSSLTNISSYMSNANTLYNSTNPVAQLRASTIFEANENSIGNLPSVPIKYSTKFILECGNVADGNYSSKTVTATVACRGQQ